VLEGARRAVDVRDAELFDEYVGLARRHDGRHYGTLEDAVGPLQTVLRGFRFSGFAVGHVGEVSRGVKDFVNMAAEVGAKGNGRDIDAVSLLDAKATFSRIGKINIAMAAWRERARLILDRAQYVGMSGRAVTLAQLRRQSAMALAVRDPLSESAQIQARVQQDVTVFRQLTRHGEGW